MSDRLVAVTGGTGFLGRYVAAALVEAGWRVRMLVRRDPSHPLLVGVPLELVPGDLKNTVALQRLVQDADAVIHLAGLVKAGSRREFMAVNRDGAEQVARAALSAAPTARCILVSSQAARQPALSPYAASKLAGEAAWIGALRGKPWIVARPSVIYGPWDRDGTALLDLATHVIAPVPTAPEPRLAMVHARDAAAAIVSLCHAGVAGRVFEITDAAVDGYGWTEILQTIGALLGRPPRPVRVPNSLMLLAGLSGDLLASVTGRRSIFGYGKACEILHRDWRPDPAQRIPADVWSPSIPFDRGMRETVEWWNKQGRTRRL